jgi:phage terminase large subunit
LAALRQEGWPVEAAENDVLSGIRVTADLLRRGKLVICSPCRDAIREFSLYCWDRRGTEDRVVKRFDHAMDEIRYFGVSVNRAESYVGGLWVERNGW